MGNTLKYKECVGWYDRDEDSGRYYGIVTNIRDVVDFYSDTFEGVEKSFQESVEDYLEFCEQRNEKPDVVRNLGAEILEGVIEIKKQNGLSSKTKISVEEVKELMDRKRYINSLNLSDIIWTENGIELDIPEDTIDDFLFMGLSNIDFITTNYYKRIG